LHRRYAGSNDPKMRFTAIVVMVFNFGIVQANDVDTT
jgi:hypothetical protein